MSTVPTSMVRAGSRFNKQTSELITDSDRGYEGNKHGESMVSAGVCMESILNLSIYLFIYFWLRWVFVAVSRLSLVAACGGYSLLWCAGFSLRWLLLLWSTGCRAQAQ